MLYTYFEALFIGCLIAIPITLILLLLVKIKVFLKSDNLARERLTVFFKNILIFGIFLLPVSFYLKGNIHSSSRKRLYFNKNEYINACFADAKNAPYSDSIKTSYIYSSFDYLNSKYGDSIYYNDFVIKDKDKIELGLLLYFINHPDLDDSIKLNIHSKVKTLDDVLKLNK
jgi:hypothetical protein